MSESEIETYLKAFFKLLQKWIDEGCIRNDVFYIDQGICMSLYLYMTRLLAGDLSEQDMREVEDYVHCKLFKENNTPFNTESNRYWAERLNKTMYKNPARLAFIKKWATKDLK